MTELVDRWWYWDGDYWEPVENDEEYNQSFSSCITDYGFTCTVWANENNRDIIRDVVKAAANYGGKHICRQKVTITMTLTV